ncbi:MAG: class B sortase [Clostridia bacterium]|nr:class B sortase [Clostridia bacterium]
MNEEDKMNGNTGEVAAPEELPAAGTGESAANKNTAPDVGAADNAAADAAAADTADNAPDTQSRPGSYVDSVEFSEEDKKRKKYIEKNCMTPRERSVSWTLVSLCVIVVAITAVYFIVDTGNRDILGFETTTAAPPTTEAELLDATPLSAAQKANLPQTDFPAGIQEKYKALYAANSDFVGWLRIPGTGIDFPVVQAPDESYDYYLRKLYDKSYSRYGAIFMDYRCTYAPFSKNTIIYGHHFLADELFFAPVEYYQDVEYYKQHPIMEFNTLYADYKWKICACFIINCDAYNDNGYVFDYIYPFMSDANFAEFMKDVEKRSYFVTPDVDIEPTDKILVLSTCTYNLTSGGDSNNCRCALVARLVRDGESSDVDVSRAYQNENPKMPQLYYNIRGISNPYSGDAKWYPSSD